MGAWPGQCCWPTGKSEHTVLLIDQILESTSWIRRIWLIRCFHDQKSWSHLLHPLQKSNSHFFVNRRRRRISSLLSRVKCAHPDRKSECRRPWLVRIVLQPLRAHQALRHELLVSLSDVDIASVLHGLFNNRPCQDYTRNVYPCPYARLCVSVSV